MELEVKSPTGNQQKRKDRITGVVCASLVVDTVISYISLTAFQ